MVGSRAVTALAGLAVSLLVSAAAWLYLDTLLVFLFVPLVPFLLGATGRSVAAHADGEQEPPRRCPACGFESRDAEFEYCPRDGRRLESAASGTDRSR
jgi:hypothetical protein